MGMCLEKLCEILIENIGINRPTIIIVINLLIIKFTAISLYNLII